MGAKVTARDCPVVAIVGDGAWCAEKKNQVDFYNNRFVGADIDGPSFAEVARSMGANGVRVERPEDLKAAYENALKSDKPTVLDIQVDGNQLTPPFRKDALKNPERLLEKYSHLDYRNC